MKFIEQTIPGVFLIEAEPFIDDRGVFRRNFCAREFTAANVLSDIVQCNVSENRHAFTLRGFHYQVAPYSEGKTLSCLSGAIHDIVVDLRKDSPTYRQWLGFELSDSNRVSVHVPPGCANAFVTLRDNTLVYYYCSNYYTPGSERGIRYNDPLFRFKWPCEPLFISDKDRAHPDYVP